MLFDIKKSQQSLIKTILNAVQNSHLKERACDIALYVNPSMHQVTTVGMMFVVEQLKVLGAIKSIDGTLALTFEGGDLLHKLSSVKLTAV